MAGFAHGLSKFDTLSKECLRAPDPSISPLPAVFGRLLPENPLTGDLSEKAILGAYTALANGMKTISPSDGPAEAGMTFFAQFVDHDITLDATSAIGKHIDPRSIRNVRTPNLDLDNIYGSGPDANPHLYSEKHDGFVLFGRQANSLDLARNARGTALIGDPRNDENIIISQLQGAFICLHNILMSVVEAGGDQAKDIHDCATMNVRSAVWQDYVPERLKSFEEVRRFIRLHYQYLVLNEMLPAFVKKSDLDAALAHDPFHDLGPVLPVEFSVAAYRFGHATVRPTYRLKRGGSAVELFAMKGFEARDSASDIDFGEFFTVNGSTPQRAQPIGTKMAASLSSLPFINKGLSFGSETVSVADSKKLALRNILRDRSTFLLPSGQQVARHLKLKQLPPPKALSDNHVTKTPLWFYCLQEAETLGGNRLTGVGAAIVASVLIRLLKLDPESILHVPDFKPWSGFGGTGMTMGSLLGYVELHRGNIAHAKDLYSG